MLRFYYVAILLILMIPAFAQGQTIKGKVVCAPRRAPLIGVTIVEKGTTNGVITDLDGKYSIELSKPEAVLVYSFVGFDSQEIAVDGKTTIDVKLKQSSEVLKEVVVLGYGSVKSKEAVVGSVEQVKSEDLLKYSTAQSVDMMLEGQIAGVRIESDGDPTSPVQVRIRGNNSMPDFGGSSFSASSEPLYVLDGVPLIDAQNPNVNRGTGGGAEIVINPLALINPEDIETITVLKDAASASIYGANAANGVVLITTKKGTRGKTRVSISHETRIGTPINEIKYLNTEEYVALATEYYRNSGMPEEQIADTVGATDIYTDWRSLTLQNSISNVSNLSISGGSDKSTYRISLSHTDSETTTKGNENRTTTGKISLDTDLTDAVKLTYKGGLTFIKVHKYGAFATYSYKPNISPYNADGSYRVMGHSANPLAYLEQNQNWSEKFNTNNKIVLEIQLLKGLTASSNFGLDYTNTRKFVFYSKENNLGREDGGKMSEVRQTDFNWLTYHQLDYIYNFGGHAFSTTAGFQMSKDNNTRTRTKEDNLITERIKVTGNSNDDDQSFNGYETNSATISYYGRLTYDYEKKYNLSFSYRADASSYFGGDQQMENFVSTGASWIVSKENFWPKNDIINFLKLKVSYGKTGNAKVGSYSAKGLYKYESSVTYNGQIIANPSDAPNEELSWQSNYKLNSGVSLKVAKNFSLDLEYYNNKTKDGIISLQVLPETGWDKISVNAIESTNYGFDGTLNVSGVKLGAVSWSSNFNINFNRSRVDYIPDVAKEEFAQRGLKVGSSNDAIVGFRYAGINPDDGKPQWYLNGVLVDRISDWDDREIIGKRNPDFSGGFSNTFRYMGFNLAVLMSYEYGGNFFLPYPVRGMHEIRNLNLFNRSADLIDRWQKPGDVTDIPRLSNSTNHNASSTQFLFDRTQIKLSSVSLGYSFPRKYLKSIYLQGMSLTFRVTNVFTWYKDDTGGSHNGLAEYRYSHPQSRVYSFKLNINI